jgi:peptidoglycan/xylan/chitin deacetylase (PgdA/CDA1 family)
VLRPGVYGGRVLLNGSPAPVERLLRSGDTLTMEPGSDRVEEMVRDVTRISAGRPGNPQFSLGTSGGRQILVRGAISGKVVKVEFQPTGGYRQPKAVALTFDDGPSARYTPQILAILQKYDVQATFFMVGVHIQEYPAVVRMVADAGMTIGNHSFSHPNAPPFRQLPRSRIKDEIHRTADALSSLGVASGLFRPPGGSFSPAVIRIAATVDARLVLWTVDPHDWGGRNPRDIVRAVLGAVKPGSIITLHDGGGDRSATVRALPRIIKGIRARGLELVAIRP